MIHDTRLDASNKKKQILKRKKPRTEPVQEPTLFWREIKYMGLFGMLSLTGHPKHCQYKSAPNYP